MQRISAMWKMGPGKAVGALAVLALAAAVFVGSGASYTDGQAVPGNLIVAGQGVTVGGTTTSFKVNEPHLLPDDVEHLEGTAAIENVGRGLGHFYLKQSDLQMTKADGSLSGGDNIAYGARIKITETKLNGVDENYGPTYDGLVANFPAAGVDLGLFYGTDRTGNPLGPNRGDQKTYTVVVTWPSNDPVKGQREGSRSTWQFDFNAVAA